MNKDEYRKDSQEIENTENLMNSIEDKEKVKENKRNNCNNLEDIKKKLKAEYKAEEEKKSEAYNEIIHLKKEENIINLNINYFENLLNKLSSEPNDQHNESFNDGILKNDINNE